MLAGGVHIIRIWLWYVRVPTCFNTRGLGGSIAIDFATTNRLLWYTGSRPGAVVRCRHSQRCIAPVTLRPQVLLDALLSDEDIPPLCRLRVGD